MRNQAILWTTIMGLSLRGLAGAAANVTVTVMPAANTYFSGEPIGLDLNITNQGPEAIDIERDYPLFEYRSHVGIKLSAATVADPDPRGLGPLLVRTEGRVSLMPLGAGESRTDRIFLQRYMNGLPIGTHRILYSVHIPYRLRSDHGAEEVAFGGGRFDVVVLPSGETELAKALEQHAESQWAREAICVTNSPLAIPYLGKNAETEPDQALDCLSKFRGNPSAEALVLQTARHGRPNSVGRALEALSGWRFPLSVAEFEHLMNATEFSVRSAALRYAAAVRNPSYLDAVRAHVTDPDPGISELALRTQRLLMEGR